MHQKLLSIVIPVYKVEDYIRKCIESLIVPNKKQLELLDIVVINDGTPDDSAIIAREYETKYPSVIRVIDQENRGHGGAWNHGTELAVGKYLFYLDSDDWFDTAELSKLIAFLQTCDTDMVFIDGKKYYAETNTYVLRKSHIDLEEDRVYISDKFDWIGTGHGWDMTYAHDTIYRTSMMQAVLPVFCEHVMYDDVSLQVIPIAIAKDFVYKRFNVYRYFIGRPGQSFDPKVRAIKAADHVSMVLVFIYEWIKKYRSVIPVGGTREAWVEENYQSMGTWHYRELCDWTYSIAKPRLKEWDKMLSCTYPDVRPTTFVKLYRTLPLWIFFPGYKLYHQYERGMRFLKRKLHIK